MRLSPALGWKAWAVRHAWLLPIVLVATWLRFTGLSGSFLYGDEAEYSIVARYLSRDLTFLAYPTLEGWGPTPFVSQPPLILYAMAFSMKIFGPTDFAAILPSVLFGIATIIAVYALGDRLGGRLVALSSAGLLAVLPFHIEMSRKAMLDAGYVFFIVLTCYFLVAWLQGRSRKHAVGVGMAAAGAALSKLPGALVGPVVLFVFVLALGITLARAARGRASKGEVKETLLQGGLGAAPVAIGALLYLGLLAYLSALSNLWIKLQWQLGRVDTDYAQVREAAAVSRPFDWYFTDPHFGFSHMLGPGVWALGIVGLIVAILLFATSPTKRTHHIVVPAMIAVFLGFFLYSERKEGFYLLPFAPLACILVAQAADGLRILLSWAGIRLRAAARYAAPIGLAGALLLVAVPAYASAVESYEDFALGLTENQYFGYGTREAALYIHEQDPDAAQYGTLLGRFTLHWYNEHDTVHWYVDHNVIEGMIESGELRYIVYDNYLDLGMDREFMRELIAKYNGQPVQTYRESWGDLTVYELRP